VLWPAAAAAALLGDHYRKLRSLLMCHHTGDIRLGAMPVGTGSYQVNFKLKLASSQVPPVSW